MNGSSLFAPPQNIGGRIGLLGGSFNPAHEGHIHLSLTAMKRLGLDAVWWLVSPQNPLKCRSDMAPLADRLAGARQITRRHPAIRPTAIEALFSTTYTANSLSLLKKRYPKARFVWLMGDDNLGQIHRWKNWHRIFSLMPVAVFARGNYSYPMLNSRAAVTFSKNRCCTNFTDLPYKHPPAWAFIPGRKHPASATAIRQNR